MIQPSTCCAIADLWEIPSEGVFKILPQVTLRRALTNSDGVRPDSERSKPLRKPLGSEKVTVWNLTQLIAQILRRNSINGALGVEVSDVPDAGQQLLRRGHLNFVTCQHECRLPRFTRAVA